MTLKTGIACLSVILAIHSLSVSADQIKNYKMNPPLTSPFQSVASFQISPDSKRVVLEANLVGSSGFFSAILSGGWPIVRLTPEMEPGYGFYSYEVDASGLWVVFDAQLSEARELFVVPIAGGTPVKLNHALGPMEGVGANYFTSKKSFKISPDGQYVVYLSGSLLPQPHINSRLYSVPIEGGPAVPLSPESMSISIDFYITPDSQSVIVIGDILFSVPVEGGPITPLTSIPINRTPIYLPPDNLQISPDSQWVVFLGDVENIGVIELYSVPVKGGQVTKLNAPVLSGGRIEDAFFNNMISSDSQTVVYRAYKQEGSSIFSLNSVPIGGGTPRNLNPAEIEPNLVCTISPDSSLVAYIGETEDRYDIYITPIDGFTSPPLRLSDWDNEGHIQYNQAGAEKTFTFTTDSLHLIYLVSGNLYRVPIAGRPSHQLTTNPPIDPTQGRVLEFRLTPDGRSIAYICVGDTYAMYELFKIPVTGGAPLRLNGPLVGNGPVGGDVKSGYNFSPDNSWVVYFADQDVDNVIELYSSTLEPQSPPDMAVWQFR